MALRSVFEDFERTTLAAIPGLLGKLHYIAQLHDGRGGYSHWGMERIHGKEAAQRAIRTAHAAVLTQVLRTSLRVLDEDLRRSASRGHGTALEFLSSLEELTVRALPDQALPATQKHFTAVLHALSALLRSQAHASPPDASPLPPLAQ